MDQDAAKQKRSRTDKPTGRLRTIVPFLLFPVTGAIFIWWTTSEVAVYARASDWVSTEGTLTSVAETKVNDTRRSKLMSRVCSITYTYTVLGKQYTGNTVNAFGTTGKLYICHELRKKMNITDNLSVYYNPRDPKESMYTIYYSQPKLALLGIICYFFITFGFSASWLCSAAMAAICACVQLAIGGNLLGRGYLTSLFTVSGGILFAFLSVFSVYKAVRTCLNDEEEDDEEDGDEDEDEAAV